MSSDYNISFDPRALRVELNLNQHEFWRAIGVTQSGGSRYENDRKMPKPVMELLRLRYQLGIDLDGITKENAAVVKAIASGKMQMGKIREDIARIHTLLQASQDLARAALQLHAAAEDLVKHAD